MSNTFETFCFITIFICAIYLKIKHSLLLLCVFRVTLYLATIQHAISFLTVTEIVDWKFMGTFLYQIRILEPFGAPVPHRALKQSMQKRELILHDI